MEQLWDMLLKSSLEREDVANLEQVRQMSRKRTPCLNSIACSPINISQENLKNNHEIQQAFRNSCSVHDSFLFRTLLELVTGIGLVWKICCIKM